MNDKAQNDGKRDAVNGNGPRDVSKDHWRTQQDYNAAYAAEKNKRS